MISVRRDFHQYPEVGFNEWRTKEKICTYLDQMGILYTEAAKTGVVGLIEGGKPGKTVALRADMDALPIKEKNDVPYKSKNEGLMHACGHDAHMTIMLGAAKILMNVRDQLAGNVKLLFQPAEETDGGAEPMIAEGVLENPKVEAIFGLHVAPEFSVGEIGWKYGQMNASSDTIHIKVKGKSAHAAYPYMGKDAIVIAAQIITALQKIVSREVDARKSAVISLGKIKGGTQGNVVADEVHLTGTVRTLDPEIRKYVLERIEETIAFVARGLGGEAILELSPGYTSLQNDDEMIEIVKKSAEDLFGKEKLKKMPMPSLGVEDFAFFAAAVPAAFFRLGCRNEEKGIIHNVHQPNFQIDEDCLRIGAAMQVKNVLSFLHD